MVYESTNTKHSKPDFDIQKLQHRMYKMGVLWFDMVLLNLWINDNSTLVFYDGLYKWVYEPMFVICPA